MNDKGKPTQKPSAPTSPPIVRPQPKPLETIDRGQPPPPQPARPPVETRDGTKKGT